MDKQPEKTKSRAKRTVVKMLSTPAAKKVIKEVATDYDMKEQGVLGRLVDWFAQQDDLTKKHVLSLLPEGYEAEIMERAAERYRQHKAQQKGKQ